jgi:hypothetical protein
MNTPRIHSRGSSEGCHLALTTSAPKAGTSLAPWQRGSRCFPRPICTGWRRQKAASGRRMYSHAPAPQSAAWASHAEEGGLPS